MAAWHFCLPPGVKSMRLVLQIADQLIGIIHSCLLLIVLFGWLLPATQTIHLVVLALVGLSWFGIGIFKGIGYCMLTDMQRRIKEHLGTNLEGPTFIASLFQKVGVTVTPLVVNILAYGFYFISLGIAVAQRQGYIARAFF